MTPALPTPPPPEPPEPARSTTPPTDEASIIARLLADRPDVGHAPIVDAGDDCAVLTGGALVTTDTMLQGVHFDHRLGPADVGWKLVAVNVSDIGAMGGLPTWAVLALSLPRPVDPDWVGGFSAGLAEALAHWGVRLVGGDTTRSPGPICATLTVGGHSAHPVLRSGARPGDDIWIAGALGEAAAGFVHGGMGLTALRRPQPPVRMGHDLGRAGLPTAMMDLSDGLHADLQRLCEASGVSAWVDPAALPLGPAVRATGSPPLDLQVAFGEDYALLFTAPPTRRAAIAAIAQTHQQPVHRIGHTLSAGAGVPTASLDSCAWPAPVWQHFGGHA